MAMIIPPVFLLTGCVASFPTSLGSDRGEGPPSLSGLRFPPFEQEPKARIGSIPCPGPFTFFTTADPRRLGTHAYSGSGETGRGIIYTIHGGFIDIAHTRKAADWTAYHQVRIKHALEHGWQSIELPSKEASDYQMTFSYPGSWKSMAGPHRQQVIRELSIVLAQRLAITQTAWHEIATWFGFSNTLYPERPSALTYDDMTSHLLGAKVAGLALHDDGKDYNSSMTWHLKQELDRLGPVSPDETMRALHMVENNWWRHGFVVRRQVDIGERNGEIAPWLVPGYPDGKTAAGTLFTIPSLKSVAGQDFSGFARVEMDPHMRVWSAMQRILPGNPTRCVPDEHFPRIMEYIRQQENAR